MCTKLVTKTQLAEATCPDCGERSYLYFETQEKFDEDGETIYLTPPILECRLGTLLISRVRIR